MITHYATNATLAHQFISKRSELTIEPTVNTPFLRYSCAHQLLMIKGSSVKPDMHEFYSNALETFKTELRDSDRLKVYLCFKDLNTSTAKVLFDLFKYLRMRALRGTDVQVVWGAEVTNQEMIETGRDFSEIYELKFRFLTDLDF